MADNKNQVVLEKKFVKKKKIIEIGNLVRYFAAGEEPRQGIVRNRTEHKGEMIFEVEFDGGVTKWGSLGQLTLINNKDNNEKS